MKIAIIILSVILIIFGLIILFLLSKIIKSTLKKTNQIKQLESILNTINQAILLFDDQNQLLFFNQDARKILKLTNNDYKKQVVSIFNSEEIRNTILKRENIEPFDFYENDLIFSVNTYLINHFKDKSSIIVTIENVTENRKVEKTKRDFFSHASHELKSPLTSIMGYSELVALKMIKVEEYEDIFLRIYNQASHMSLLVEEMSVLSKLELTPNDEVFELIDLNAILNNVITSLDTLIQTKNIKINLESESIIYEALDLDIFKLFKNLIENALKYSKNNSEINISLKNLNDQIIFSVEDFGSGILKKHQQRIFERFYRVEKSRLISGSGLGLAIVKHILIKYKGLIEVESETNKGTKMTVKLNK